MRALLISAVFAASALTAVAQQQEQKLMDRLLKPDMSLKNRAQGKQFIVGGSTLTKQAHTKLFYVSNRRAEKKFTTGNFATTGFTTSTSRYQEGQANVSTPQRMPNINDAYPTSGYADVRSAADSDKTVAVSAFRGTRPFLVRGKSQKILSAQDRPLTVDQVRELLNKNK